MPATPNHADYYRRVGQAAEREIAAGMRQRDAVLLAFGITWQPDDLPTRDAEPTEAEIARVERWLAARNTRDYFGRPIPSDESPRA
jgi:hypothetical protein